MEPTVQLVSILVVLLVFVVNSLQFITRRRGGPPLRRIEAYEALPTFVSESVEANRPLHLSLGSAAIGQETTVLALAGSEFAYYVTRQISVSDVSPIFTVTDTATVPLAFDTLRRAYQSQELLSRYRPINVRWYPAGARSLVFAAGVSAIQREDDISANALTGSFGTELALILDTAQRQGRGSLAVSDRLDGQAVAYAMADYVLIGEEIFTAASYLGDSPALKNRSIAMDLLRWLLVIALLILLIATLLTRL